MANRSNVPDASDSASDPARSRPGPGRQGGGGSSDGNVVGGGGGSGGSGGGGIGGCSSSHDSSTVRAPNVGSASFVNPVRILSHSPSHGPPGTFVHVCIQVSTVEQQGWQLNCLVGLDGFDLWSEAFPLPSHGPDVLLIRALIPDVVGYATTQPLSLRIYEDSGETLCTIPFGMFHVTPTSQDQSAAQQPSSTAADPDDTDQAAPTDPRLALAEPPRRLNQWQDDSGGVSLTQTAVDLLGASAGSAFASASQGFPQGLDLASQISDQTDGASSANLRPLSRRYGAPTQRPVLLAPRFDDAGDQQPSEPRAQTVNSSSNTEPASASFNAYSIYPNKAVLIVQDGLEAVARQWTAQELEIGRRIVAFRRKQSGPTISISFSVVPEGQQDADTFSVSCIWWKEREQAFITSVDTIHLLQSIMNIRFTVEEKNRIRRNLEGFHPLTVSKTRRDCESFFALVMGLPEPKPRNIEKDVKIFEWAQLESALKKIVSKYTASPSSTAGFLNPSSSAAAAAAAADASSFRDEGI